MSKFQRLKELLHPSTIYERIVAPGQEIFRTYEPRPGTVKDVYDLQERLAHYTAYYMEKRFRVQGVERWFIEGKYRNALRKYKTLGPVLIRAMNGFDGGMYGILQEVHEAFQKEDQEQYVASCFRIVNEHDLDEMVSLMTEFLREAGPLLSGLPRKPQLLIPEWKQTFMQYMYFVAGIEKELRGV